MSEVSPSRLMLLCRNLLKFSITILANDGHHTNFGRYLHDKWDMGTRMGATDVDVASTGAWSG